MDSRTASGAGQESVARMSSILSGAFTSPLAAAEAAATAAVTIDAVEAFRDMHASSPRLCSKAFSNDVRALVRIEFEEFLDLLAVEFDDRFKNWLICTSEEYPSSIKFFVTRPCKSARMRSFRNSFATSSSRSRIDIIFSKI